MIVFGNHATVHRPSERPSAALTLGFDSFSGYSLVYPIVLFRQKFPLVSVIVLVRLANLSCCCDHCVNVANKPDKKNVRQRTPPSELILFWSHVTSVFQGLSLSRSVGRVGENPGNEVAAPQANQCRISGSLWVHNFLARKQMATRVSWSTNNWKVQRSQLRRTPRRKRNFS